MTAVRRRLTVWTGAAVVDGRWACGPVQVVDMHGKNTTKFEHHKDWSHVLLDDSIVRMLGNRYRTFPGKQYAYCRLVLPWFTPSRKNNAPKKTMNVTETV